MNKKEEQEIMLQIAEEEDEEYKKEHYKICPQCGCNCFTDIKVNNAGEVTYEEFECIKCGCVERKDKTITVYPDQNETYSRVGQALEDLGFEELEEEQEYYKEEYEKTTTDFLYRKDSIDYKILKWEHFNTRINEITLAKECDYDNLVIENIYKDVYNDLKDWEGDLTFGNVLSLFSNYMDINDDYLWETVQAYLNNDESYLQKIGEEQCFEFEDTKGREFQFEFIVVKAIDKELDIHEKYDDTIIKMINM